MGNKRMKHLNELRVRAIAGDKLAQQRLAEETFVAHHLRQPLGLLKYATEGFKRGMLVTAKTLKTVAVRDHNTIPGDYGFDRLQMLKDRRARREARA